MFEAITLGVMLHSHHFDPLSPEPENAAEVQSLKHCLSEGRCGSKNPDTGEVFKYNDGTVGLYAISNGWTAAAFHNSFNRLSVFGGYTLEKETRYGIFGLTGGFSTGYQYRDHAWTRDGITYTYRSGFTNAVLMPVGMLSYATPKLFNTDARMRLMYTPRKNVLTLGVEKQF